MCVNMNAEDVEGETRLTDSAIHTCQLCDVGNTKIIINNKTVCLLFLLNLIRDMCE